MHTPGGGILAKLALGPIWTEPRQVVQAGLLLDVPVAAPQAVLAESAHIPRALQHANVGAGVCAYTRMFMFANMRARVCGCAGVCARVLCARVRVGVHVHEGGVSRRDTAGRSPNKPGVSP